jgi:hypothetical protein
MSAPLVSTFSSRCKFLYDMKEILCSLRYNSFNMVLRRRRSSQIDQLSTAKTDSHTGTFRFRQDS